MDHAREVAEQLEALQLTIPARAHDGGHLFGSVTEADVVAAIRTAGGPPVEKRAVTLPGHIKSTGTAKAQVVLHPEVTAVLTVEVVPA